MTSDIVPYQGNSIIRSFDDVERAAKAMAQSGFFKDSTQAAQAVVKILAGQEIGFGPFASMKGVYIIQGGPSFSANLMAAAVKKSGRYNYRVLEMTNDACEIAFYEGKEEIGRSRFTKEDATKAGTQNMTKFPRNMLFARAMSNGVKWYCPDVFNGNTVYTPEELGAQVNEDGDIIEGTITQSPASNPPDNGNGSKPTETAAPKMSREMAEDMMTTATAKQPSQRYGDLDNDTLSNMTIGIGKALSKPGLAVSEKERYQQKMDAIAAILYYREQDDEAARAEMDQGADN